TATAELTLNNSEFDLALRKPSVLRADKMLSTTPAVPAPAIAPSAPAPLSPTEPAATAASAIDPTLVAIKSPMVGTFYRSPTPDEASFVEVGDRIQTGQTVCIIEAMKLMNELEAEVSGEVVDILVENAEPIEFGQPLMRIRPLK
ncbi:MAG: acetyl-CoA carboxylase biotin carboxyl carrier protein, partial [Phormidesmis sp.]